MTHNWLWLDVETTGLDEHAGQLLEVAAAVVDDGALGSFEIIESVEAVILPAAEMVMDPYVRAMHTKNGLLQAIAMGHGMALGDADEMIRAFVDQYLPPGEKVILAGDSVHFDQRWIKAHLPGLAERLHHRVFDVTTLRQMARVWGPGFESTKSDKHRALYDVQCSVKDAKRILDLISS